MDDDVYNSDDARPHSPLLPEAHPTYTPRDPTPPFVHSDKSESPPAKGSTSGRVRKRPGWRGKVSEIADTLILRNLVHDRPYIADELAQKPLRTEAEDFEAREQEEREKLNERSRRNKRTSHIGFVEERIEPKPAPLSSETPESTRRDEKNPSNGLKNGKIDSIVHATASRGPAAQPTPKDEDIPVKERVVKEDPIANQKTSFTPGSVSLPEMRSPQNTPAASPVTSLPPLKDTLPSHIVDIPFKDSGLRRVVPTLPFHPHLKPPPRSLSDHYFPPSFAPTVSCSQTPSASPCDMLAASPAAATSTSSLSPFPPLSSEISQSQSPHEISLYANSPSVAYPTPPECRKRDSTDCLSPPSKHLKPSEPAAGGFQCDFPGCNAQPFQTQYLLNSHRNVHSQHRPYYCSVKDCPRAEGGKGFKRKNEMIRHGLVHESPGYICPFCPDQQHRYPRPDNLQRHVRAHHEDRDKNDPLLRHVLAKRQQGAPRGRRRRS